MLFCLNHANPFSSTSRLYKPAFTAACIFTLAMFCNSAFSSQVTYSVVTQGGLYASNLELLGAVTDASGAQYLAEYDVYYTIGGAASGSFTYDNTTTQYLVLSNVEARVGGFLATSATGGIFVADGTFNPSVPYDPSEPTADGLSLHLGNAAIPGFSGFSIGDWTLSGVAASWFGGEFISDTSHPLTLPPASGYETNVLTFIFNNSSGDTAIITAPGMEVSPVPVPAAAWLFGSALIGLAAIRRKKQS